MALFRAMESVRPPHQRLFVDPFAPYFLRASLRNVLRLSSLPALMGLVERYVDWRLPGARSSAIARTMFIDDLLLQALSDEISQVVILGAGFDCRAYRLPRLNAGTVYEVDYPATLNKKLACLHRALSTLPANVRFVAMDFNHQSLPDVLEQAGLEPSKPIVFLWEGVTNYLTPEAVDSVVSHVARCSPGSRLIFTYVEAAALDGSVFFAGAERLLRDVADLGEPWTFGLHPRLLTEFLRKRGLCLDIDLSANEYTSRYFGAAAQRMTGYEFYHVANARVPGRSTDTGPIWEVEECNA